MKMLFKLHILLLLISSHAGGGTLTRPEYGASIRTAVQNYMKYGSNDVLTIYVTFLLVVPALSLLAVLRCLKRSKDKNTFSKQLAIAEVQLQLAKLQQKVDQLESENVSLRSEQISLQQKSSLLSKENRQLKKKAAIAGAEKIHLKSLLKKHQDSPLYPKQLKSDDDEGTEKSVAIQIESNEIKRKTKRVTFAPYMVLEKVCHFDDSGLLRDIIPIRKTKLSA